MFLGKHNHVLDSKSRLAIPARFRELIKDNAVLTRGADRCLVIYPQARWQLLCARIGELPLSDRDARTFRRFLFSDAAEIELDTQGRMIIPVALRVHAEIDRAVVLVGMDTVIEVWSDAAWARMSTSFDDQANEIVDRLASMI